MKRLILVRHGKAEQSKGLDFNRNLISLGEERSREMARLLKSMGLIPDLIISSSAMRTKQTAECISDVFGCKRDQISDMTELYLANEEVLGDIIKLTEDEINCLLVVGHNNGISDFVTSLALSGTYLLKTSGTIVFDLNIDHWSELQHHSAIPVWNYRLNMY